MTVECRKKIKGKGKVFRDCCKNSKCSPGTKQANQGKWCPWWGWLRPCRRPIDNCRTCRSTPDSFSPRRSVSFRSSTGHLFAKGQKTETLIRSRGRRTPGNLLFSLMEDLQVRRWGPHRDTRNTWKLESMLIYPCQHHRPDRGIQHRTTRQSTSRRQ